MGIEETARMIVHARARNAKSELAEVTGGLTVDAARCVMEAGCFVFFSAALRAVVMPLLAVA